MRKEIEEIARLVQGHNHNRVRIALLNLADYYDCKYVEDLEVLTDEQIYRFRQIGKITLNDIRTSIEYYFELKSAEGVMV